MKKNLFLSLPWILIFTSCAPQTVVTLGSGGGFSGTATVYKVTSKGEVLRGRGIGPVTFTEAASLKRSTARKLVKDTSARLAASTDFSHPGNLYYFLSVSDEGQEKKITWGDNQFAVPGDVTQAYRTLDSVVAPLDFKPLAAK